VALCEGFAALGAGEEIPEYRAVLLRESGETVAVRWELAAEAKPRELHWEG
jgi:hypothetical protein